MLILICTKTFPENSKDILLAKSAQTSKAKKGKNSEKVDANGKLKPEPKTEDNTTDKKKTGQRYFQCIYVPGKGAQYPLRPGMSPAMNPAMMSPAIRSMLEQQRAPRAAGQ
ncbi:unnamed protein product [Arctogadus glacialis]